MRNIQAVMVKRVADGVIGYVKMDCSGLVSEQHMKLDSYGYERLAGVSWENRDAVAVPSRTIADMFNFQYMPVYWGEI